MKSSIDKLTAGERELLAKFIDTPTHIALKKLIEVERIELAKDHVDQSDILIVRYLSGQVQSLRKLVLTLKKNYTDQVALEKKKTKKV